MQVQTKKTIAATLGRHRCEGATPQHCVHTTVLAPPDTPPGGSPGSAREPLVPKSNKEGRET